jgi:hypothetical protein
VQISQGNVVLSDEDAIGFIRPHPRIGEKVQRSALNEDGVKGIVDDRKAIERMACKGRMFKVRHLFLFAEPKARKGRGGWRKDLLDFMGRVEDKGAVIKDVDLQLTTEKPSHRSAMVLQAIEHLAKNGRTVHLKGKRSGRKRTIYSPEVEAAIEKIWLNTRDYPTDDDAMKAIHKIDKTYSQARARKNYLPRYKRQT